MQRKKRLAVLYFRWDEVAPLLRGMYARQQDGFGQEQPQPATESPDLPFRDHGRLSGR